MVRSQPFSNGVPSEDVTSHGPASTSTNVSASSLRHTNELHKGCSTARNRPTSNHFASDVTPHATRPAPSSTPPDSSVATAQPNWPTRPSKAASTKIGRAACRERGENSGGAGALKKKK